MHGRSVGTGPATHIAADHPVGGLILESGFTSAFRVITRWPILPFDRFNNVRLLPDVDAPVLIIHGSRDRIIAPHHAAALYRVASEPRFFGRYRVPVTTICCMSPAANTGDGSATSLDGSSDLRVSADVSRIQSGNKRRLRGQPSALQGSTLRTAIRIETSLCGTFPSYSSAHFSPDANRRQGRSW
jgi:hypothetical protein